MKRTLHIITIAIVALLSATTANAASGIDWNAIGWVSENGNTAYAQKYKVSQDNGQPNIVNIQNKDGQLAIYVHVPAAITECSVSSVIGGAGIWLHLSAFTAQETQVTIKYDAGNKSCTFWVYYADGSGDAGGSDDSGDSGDSGDPDLPTPPTVPSDVNWDDYGWVNHVGYTEYANQYKVQTGCVRTNPIEIQNRNGIGIYVTFTKAVQSCSVDSHCEGAGMWIYLSALPNRETEVIVTFADGTTCSFWVLNAKVEQPNPDQPVEEGVCTYEGGSGDGLLSLPGKDLFATGYEVTLQLDNTLENIIVKATTNDGPATKAVFQNYYTFIEKEANNEQYMDGGNTSTFTKTIPVSWIKNKEDGIIRFAIKFEYPNGVIKVTTPEFFYLDGSGCAQRVFAIYHHDDVPATPFEGEDQFTEFSGGRILQQIQYKRILRPDSWETLSIPFDVDSVTVYDPATGTSYLMQARYYDANGKIVEGHYWLRYFKTKEVTSSEFQPNWYDINATSAENAKPEKDKAYIIRVPAGDFYLNKYLVFHGRGYQTIASEYNVPELPEEDGYYSYSGNNTMMPQLLTSAYVLNTQGTYFQSDEQVKLYPFECSVNATAATIARMPRISLNDRERTVTDVENLPTTDLSDGVIYTVYGAAVAEFHSLEQYDEARAQLPAGVYLVTTPTSAIKICVQ